MGSIEVVTDLSWVFFFFCILLLFRWACIFSIPFLIHLSVRMVLFA